MEYYCENCRKVSKFGDFCLNCWSYNMLPMNGANEAHEANEKRKNEMGKIKILSVRQPWAWLICAGYKNVENRSWKTNYRGRLYIHAGKSFDWNAIGFCRLIGEHRAAQIIYGHFVPYLRICTSHQDEFGAIVGYVDITGCIQNSSSIWAMHGLYHWQLQNAAEIAPIPMKGQLGIFEADETIVEGL